MSSATNRFIGGSPIGVLLKLVLVSLLVGVVLSALGMTPMTVIDGIVGFFQRLWNLGFDALGQFGNWLILGATLVVPVWFVMRLLESRR
ncbi:MAG: DUF6460 domain-containing protein [Hyphomicrobiales bacterium]